MLSDEEQRSAEAFANFIQLFDAAKPDEQSDLRQQLSDAGLPPEQLDEFVDKVRAEQGD